MFYSFHGATAFATESFTTNTIQQDRRHRQGKAINGKELRSHEVRSEADLQEKLAMFCGIHGTQVS